MKKPKKLLSLVMACTVALTTFLVNAPALTAKADTVANESPNTKTASQQYIDAMGHGWNLGNTLEAYDWNNIDNSNENSWGQPTVTPEFLVGLKAKGFNSIRLPFAVYPAHTKDSSGHYLISQTRLARYKQVVDWAVAAGLYVQVDLHDPWYFLNHEHFNGDTSQESYVMFKDFWTDLAVTLKDEPSQVCFETLNEPAFEDEKDSNGNVTISKQDKLNMVNQAAYDAIRHAGGNNATRMIVIPSMETNYGTTGATYDWISALNDPNIIATVHWYSEWYYAAAIGRTGFDEELYPDRPGYTPRSADQVFFDAVNTNLISKGVGVVIGEFGMLTTFTQSGEETKYFEDMYNKAKQYNACLMLWDCNILNRNDMSWLRPLHGAVVDAALKGERSSYGTGLNETYLSKPVDNGVQIPLTLNGNTFTGIDGLTAGTDYTYDAATATVTLTEAYVNSKFDALAPGQYGNIADLVFKFSAGADWHQTLIKYASPVLKPVTGTTSGISIPVDFNGTELRRARAVMLNDDGTDGKLLGPCSSWGWPWLVCGDWSDFYADYNKKVININSGCLTSWYMPANGKIKLTFELYDGQTVNYILTKSGSDITGEAPAPIVTTIAINPTAPNGNDGWYTSAVTVSLTTNYNSSSVAKTEYSLDGGTTWQTYEAPFTVSTDGQYTVSYRSTDNSGNVEKVKSISFKLDLTGPTINATGVVNGTYNDSSDITPVITLDDKFSGVDASKTTVTLDGKAVQQGAAIQLYTLPLGSHTFIVTASDLAGNTSSQTIVFQTSTSIESIQALVTCFTNAGWIDNAGVANSLQSKLSSNALAALVNEVKAQRGKHISAEAADFLIRDAQYLLSQTTGQ